ncbi:peptidase inhibitor family I36 protein [Streptomyces sp. SM11]|uniref:peptidase inhibitor family I36 protein n=1 Tax=Streptomyces sp. SM11 TaxID=565557 RepID=UPI0015E17F56|nr:peptidase inhibitor family I36 protein [Streptomyces sp. SM11]
MRAKKVIASTALLFAALAMTPSTANAALSQCNSNNMCLWGNNDFAWLIGERGHGQSSFANLSGEKNDEMDSWANRSASYDGCMTEHANGGGDKQGMRRASNDNNVSPLNSDEVTSFRTSGGC